MNDRDDRRRSTRCSFCGKGQDQVRKLVAGPGVYICDQCISLCQEVLEEDNRSAGCKKANGYTHELRTRFWGGMIGPLRTRRRDRAPRTKA